MLVIRNRQQPVVIRETDPSCSNFKRMIKWCRLGGAHISRGCSSDGKMTTREGCMAFGTMEVERETMTVDRDDPA
jgi:hypothetical protein